MPQEFINCVDALIKQGHPKNSAYAICTAQYKKRHKGHTPQMDEHATLDDIALMTWFHTEIMRIRELKKG